MLQTSMNFDESAEASVTTGLVEYAVTINTAMAAPMRYLASLFMAMPSFKSIDSVLIISNSRAGGIFSRQVLSSRVDSRGCEKLTSGHDSPINFISS